MLRGCESGCFRNPFPLGRSLLRRDADVQSRRSRNVLTDKIPFTRFTGAVPVTLAVADEEVDDVLIAVVAVGYSVLPEDGRRLDEEVGSFGPLGCFGELVCAH
jgi:hypothetical protein